MKNPRIGHNSWRQELAVKHAGVSVEARLGSPPIVRTELEQPSLFPLRTLAGCLVASHRARPPVLATFYVSAGGCEQRELAQTSQARTSHPERSSQSRSWKAMTLDPASPRVT